MDKVRLGIVGLGRIFRLGYLPWLKEYLSDNPHCELSAVSDTREEPGAKYARKLRSEFFSDLDGILESKGVDAVIINTPNWAHEEHVIKAAEAGVHVLCEKPMAPSVEACERMIEACDRNDVLLLIGFMRRFNMGFQKIREMVKGGEIGDIIELTVNWPYFIPDLDKRPYKETIGFLNKYLKINLLERYGAWRLKDPRSGGGDFLDHGPHIVDFFRWIAGDITHVTGVSHSLVPGRNEDYTRCILRFNSGALGSITTSLSDPRSGLVGKVYGLVRGTKGCIEFTLPDVDRFKPISYLKLYKEPDSSPGRMIRGLGLMKSRKIILPENEVFEEQLDYFTRTILGKREPHPVFGEEDFAATGEDGKYTIRIVELCYRSASTNETYEV